jgi:hypothetical protein
LVGQGLELFEIVDLLLDPFSRWSGNALAELSAALESLQNKVGALGHGASVLLSSENLAAESASPQTVDGLKLGQKSISLGRELVD